MYQVYFEVVKFAEFETERQVRSLANLENARYMALNLSSCADIYGTVDVVDALTGEVVAIYKCGKAYDPE